MDNATIISELEAIYRAHQKNGNFEKAQEVLFKITEMKQVPESVDRPNQNILLG